MASKLEILINAKNNASRELKAVQQDVAGVENAAGAMGKSLGGLVAFGAAAAGVAAGVGLIAKEAWSLGAAAVPVMRLRDSFQQVAASYGQSGDEMLAAMQKASRGTIAEGDLMLAANRAMLLGVAASADEMAGLIDVAAKRGAAMGLSTAQAFDDIVTGIGRMSPMILDNLGITVDAENTFTAYAAAIGKTAEQLSDAEKKQALLNRIIADSAGLAQPAVDDMARMNVAIVEAKQAMGELFAPAVLAIASGIADQAERLRMALEAASSADLTIGERNEIHERIAELQQELVGLSENGGGFSWASWMFAGGEDQLVKERIASIRAEIDLLRLQLEKGTTDPAALLGIADQAQAAEEAVARAAQAAAALSSSAAQMAGVWGNVANSEVAAAEAAARAGDSHTRMTGVMDGLNASLSGAPAKLAALAQGLGQAAGAAAQAAGMIAGFESQIAGLAASMVGIEGAAAMKSTVAGITGELSTMQQDWEGIGLSEAEIVALSNTYLSNLNKASTATYSLGKTASGTNSEFSSLESTISGIISSATGPVAGVNAEDFLPREEAVNENARRLADIMVNGLTGQDWLGEFASEVPGIWEEIQNSGDPAGTAAQILKDFQDGLRPELLDRGKAKELAKRAILGDQNAKALAKELAGELSAEMGISLGQAQAAVESALGVSSGGGGGGTATTVTPVVDTSGMAAQLEPLRTFVITPVLDASGIDVAAAFTTITEKMSVRVTPFIDAASADTANAVTFITEKMHVRVTPFIDVANTDTATATEFLGSVIAPQVAPNIRADLANSTAAAFAIVAAMNPLMAITPYLDASTVDASVAVTTLTEKMHVRVTPFIDVASADTAAATEFLGSVIAPQVTPNIRADLANSTAAAFALVDAMNPLMAITPYISTSGVDFATPTTTMIEALHVRVTPFIDVASADTAAATEFLGSVIAPQVAPNIRADLANTSAAAFALVDAMNPLMAITPYISMAGVDLVTPTTTMIEGLPVHISPHIDVDQDTLMAKGMLIADYINAGLRNTSGMSGADGETQSPFAAAMVNQIAASDVGNVVVTMIAGQIAANMATVETAGKMAGTRFSMGFVNGIENIPAATLSILGRLVAPYVAAASTAAAGQTGASNE